MCLFNFILLIQEKAVGVIIRLPKKATNKVHLIGVILMGCYFGMIGVGNKMRDASDLQSPHKLCGVVHNYKYVQQRIKGGVDRWVLSIRYEADKKMKINTTIKYLNQPLQSAEVKVGDDICIEYADEIPSLFGNGGIFVTQIYIDGKAIVDPKKPLATYMKNRPLPIYISFVALIVTLFSVVRIDNKEEWR